MNEDILIEKSLFRADSHTEYGSHWIRKFFKDPDWRSQAGIGWLGSGAGSLCAAVRLIKTT